MKKIQLSIPEPCHQNWDGMTPTQHGRYCNACAKEVIDFSNMSDSDVLNYFLKEKNDTICGRAFPDQLDRNIYAASQKKKYWQWQYILTAFLFFMKPAKTKAQGAVVYITADTASKGNPLKEKVSNIKKITINGIIKDEKGIPVPFASIKIKGTNKGSSAKENGSFSLEVDSLAVSLQVSAVGYVTKQVSIEALPEKEIALAKHNQLMKEVIIVTADTRVMGGAMVCKVIRRRSVKNTFTNWVKSFDSPIKIYPNPVTKGNSFTVDMKLKHPGSYTIQIIDAAGRPVSEKKITASAKEYKEQFTSSSTWSGGVYYVKVVDDKGKLISTGSLVMQ